MSGGSMGYLYSKLEDAHFPCHTPERRAFYKHLKLAAKALHDIEWVDSCDYGHGDENEAIRACIGDGVVMQAAIEQAQEALEALRSEIERASGINAGESGLTEERN